MALTPSTMLELGTVAPTFRLINAVDGQPVALDDVAGPRGLLVMFICNHCPYVVHIRQELIRVAHQALDRGIGVVAINANSQESHPQDGPPQMKELARTEGWRFPFLFDDTQEVAKAYRAACTPDLFLFDKDRRLYYRGQFDGSRPGNQVPVTGGDLSAAMEQMLAARPAPSKQRPSMGCNIKWKPGSAPAYFGAG
ncbi:MAG: thioredoxin family protein [Myxococcota bacterium]